MWDMCMWESFFTLINGSEKASAHPSKKLKEFINPNKVRIFFGNGRKMNLILSQHRIKKTELLLQKTLFLICQNASIRVLFFKKPRAAFWMLLI